MNNYINNIEQKRKLRDLITYVYCTRKDKTWTPLIQGFVDKNKEIIQRAINQGYLFRNLKNELETTYSESLKGRKFAGIKE